MLRDTAPGEGAAISGGDGGPSDADNEQPDWAKLARAANDASTSWINSSRRSAWNDSLALFQGRHPSGSKYHGTDYRYRSRLFRPKARATVRKTEAATATAFFSTEDVCEIAARNPDDEQQQASAALMKELIQIRLTEHIPWFLCLIGARQDCENYGLCVSRQYWKYDRELIGKKPAIDDFGSQVLDENGEPAFDEEYQIKADHPDIMLIAPDNFRFDPGCDWMRPVETSPYIIERIPMFVGEVREKMHKGDWKEYNDGEILAAKGNEDDATKRAREQGRQPSDQSQTSSVRDFDLTYVHLNTLRWKAVDYVFFTLGSDKLLTEPKPHVELYGTTRRPYRIGITNLEAHRNYPASKMELIRDLQSQANDTTNLRLDGLKLSLQPRPKVKAGSAVANNLADFRIMTPGKPFVVSQMDDVEWDKPPDVSEASYQEQDRINADFDELAGSASQSISTSPGAANETLGGMELLTGAAGSVAEYELRLFVETWVKPVVEDLVDLEQRLEEDETILALAGQRAGLVQKYGITDITDWLLSQKLTTKVNVGTGATNPRKVIADLTMAAKVLTTMFGPAVAMGLEFDEICKVVFGSIGQADGKRFFKPGFDIQQAQMQMEQVKAQAKQKMPAPPDPTKLQAVQIKAQTDLTNQREENANQLQLAQMTAERDRMHHAAEIYEAQLKHDADMRKQQLDHAVEIRTNVIRTLPPTLAKLVSDHHDRASRERIAKHQAAARRSA